MNGRRSSRPIIGLTAYRQVVAWGPWEREAVFVPVTYVDVVAAAGGQPVLLPPLGRRSPERADSRGAWTGREAEDLVRVLDGLVLVGGGDVGPHHYGAEPHPQTAGTSEGRDRLELDLVRRVVGEGLPVLAVCRGLQILNVALGGDLLQHLPDRTGSTAHLPVAGTFSPVTVVAEAGSHVRRLCGERFEVRCHHHQVVDRLGAGLQITAQCTDGVVEAAELDGHPFAVGVQWHPEETCDLRLFRGLVDAAASPA